MYRTGSLGEVVDLALAELVEEDAVALVEWGDLAAPALGESALEVTLAAPDAVGTPERRTVRVDGRGRWADRADEVAAALAAVGAGAGVVSAAQSAARPATSTSPPSWRSRRPPRRWAWRCGHPPGCRPSSP